MRSKLIFIGVIVFLALYIRFLSDPLNATAAFLIAGIIPGTKIMLGVWPMVVFTLIIIYFLAKYIAHIKLKFLENTSQTIKKESAKKQFEDAHKTDFARKDSSVIAAPKATVIN